jgi:hypothetical protein
MNRTFYIAEVNGDTNFQHVTLEIKPKLILILLFYIDEDHKGKHMISESAQTRLQNVKKNSWYDDKIYKAHCIPIQSVDEIITQTTAILKKHEDKNVYVHEMGVFSHAGGDGPISYNKDVINCPADPTWPHQMSECGWEQLKVVWSLNSKCVFYGCNTANEGWGSFAKKLSNLANFKDVEVCGQTTSSFPSYYPNYRVTSVARSMGGNGTGWDIREKTYQVGGNPGEGKKALSLHPFKDTLSEDTLKKGGYPIANPINFYKNGILIKSTHQGVFNDHR